MANPTGKGGAVKGERRNPSGLSKEQAEARRILSVKLTEPASVERFWLAYQAAAEGGNATILIDYANRLMGKVKEEIEVTDTGNRELRDVAISKLLKLADELK